MLEDEELGPPLEELGPPLEDEDEEDEEGNADVRTGAAGNADVRTGPAGVTGGLSVPLACTTDALSSKSISAMGWKLIAMLGVGTV